MSYMLDFLLVFTYTSIVVTTLAIFMLRRGWLPPIWPAPKKVLIADNNSDFRETRAELLEDEGYKVYQAGTPEEAEAWLEGTPIDVAIIDVRLRDDTDDNDRSGITLAKEETYRLVPKIIFTGYPNYEHAREVLAAPARGLPPAVAFLGKQEGGTAMLREVKQVFDKYVYLN